MGSVGDFLPESGTWEAEVSQAIAALRRAVPAAVIGVALGLPAGAADLAPGESEKLTGTWEGSYVYISGGFEGQSTLEVTEVSRENAATTIEWRWGQGENFEKSYEAVLHTDANGRITGLEAWPAGGVLTLDGNTLVGELELIPGRATHIYNKR